ncbi:MAG: lipid A deacylase LpxR family protein [Elusimicrobia bacterium]|nr:lipid A deacylase LpxR family protein [Elusimicrobiota bacterium]
MLFSVFSGGAFAEGQAADGFRPLGILTIGFENDVLVGNDNHYTSGLSLGWTTAELNTLGPKNVFSQAMNVFSFVPPLRRASNKKYVNFSVVQEMYTPVDIASVTPPPEDQPYAGVLMADLNLLSKSVRSLHHVGLSGGVVGPASGAQWVQEKFHEWVGAEIPQGWNSQLGNELLLNVAYQYHRRVRRATKADGVDFDLSLNGGGSLGNYLTGANGGALFRFGSSLPDTYGSFALRRGGESYAGLETSSTSWRWFLFAHLNGLGVAQFIPTDGNSFRESAVGHRDSFSVALSSGFLVVYRRFLMTYSMNTATYNGGFPRNNDENYGSITLSFVL